MIYLHIGLPRVMSTSIQHYFDQCQSSRFKYVGFKPNSIFPNKYENQLISRLLNIDMRFGDSRHFEKNKNQYIHYFNSLLDNFHDLFLSCENISLNIELFEPDFLFKIKRLQQILPSDQPIKIIICFRDVNSFLKSIYKNYVSIGYAKSFKYFLDELFFYQEISFLDYLYPHSIAKRLSSLLSDKVRLYMIFPEHDCDTNSFNSANCIDQILNILAEDGVSTSNNHCSQIQWMNKSSSDQEVFILRLLNKFNGIPLSLSSFHEQSRFILLENYGNCFYKLRTIQKNRNIASFISRCMPVGVGPFDFDFCLTKSLSSYSSLKYAESVEYFSKPISPFIQLRGDWYSCYASLRHAEESMSD